MPIRRLRNFIKEDLLHSINPLEKAPEIIVNETGQYIKFEVDRFGHCTDPKVARWIARTCKTSSLKTKGITSILNDTDAVNILLNRLDRAKQVELATGILRYANADLIYPIKISIVQNAIFGAVLSNNKVTPIEIIPFDDILTRLTSNFDTSIEVKEAQRLIAEACLSIIKRNKHDQQISVDLHRLATYVLDSEYITENEKAQVIPAIVKMALGTSPDFPDTRKYLQTMIEERLPEVYAEANAQTKVKIANEVKNIIIKSADFDRDITTADFIEDIGLTGILDSAVEKIITDSCCEESYFKRVDVDNIKSVIDILEPAKFARTFIDALNMRKFPILEKALEAELANRSQVLGDILTLEDISDDQRNELISEIKKSIINNDRLDQKIITDVLKGFISYIAKPENTGNLSDVQKATIIEMVPDSISATLVETGFATPDQALSKMSRNIPEGSPLDPMTIDELTKPGNGDTLATLAALQAKRTELAAMVEPPPLGGCAF